MRLWQDGILAALAAVGVAAILWAAVKAALFRAPRSARGTAALVPASGGGEHLEEQVGDLIRLREEQGVFGEILLVDCGLTEEGRKLARCLARRDRWVTFCGREEIGEHLGADAARR